MVIIPQIRIYWEKQAQKRVWLETYIVEPDLVGSTTLNHLIDARKRGCDVRLLYDTVVSISLFYFSIFFTFQ